MKKILLTSVAVVMATFASNAAVHPYVSAHLGYTNPTTEIADDYYNYTVTEAAGDEFAYDLSGAFGLKFDLSRDFALRGEVEYDYVEGFVYSTEPLEKDKILEISKVISQKIHKKVELKNKIDERLIGGVKVVVHDHVFDGSIKYKLETMKEQLKERRNG